MNEQEKQAVAERRGQSVSDAANKVLLELMPVGAQAVIVLARFENGTTTGISGAQPAAVKLLEQWHALGHNLGVKPPEAGEAELFQKRMAELTEAKLALEVAFLKKQNEAMDLTLVKLRKGEKGHHLPGDEWKAGE